MQRHALGQRQAVLVRRTARGARSVRVPTNAATASAHLIAQAEEGRDVVIARNGVPAARIVPIREPVARTVELLRQERKERPAVSAEEIRAARDEGRA